MVKNSIKTYLKGMLTPGQIKVLRKIQWKVLAFESIFYSNDLVKLGKIFRTDKVDRYHTHKGQNYLHIYEQYFREFRGEFFNLLEIGVLNGSSLRVWKRYFPKATIYGLDIDPNTKQHEERRIFIEIGNQADENVLRRLSSKAGSFDIIIDDGSHVNKHIIKSFEYLFGKLNKRGLYIIEDLGCSYQKLEEVSIGDGRRGVRELWPGMQYNKPDENLDNDRRDIEKFFEKIIYDIDHDQGGMLSIHFWPALAIIMKA